MTGISLRLEGVYKWQKIPFLNKEIWIFCLLFLGNCWSTLNILLFWPLVQIVNVIASSIKFKRKLYEAYYATTSVQHFRKIRFSYRTIIIISRRSIWNNQGNKILKPKLIFFRLNELIKLKRGSRSSYLTKQSLFSLLRCYFEFFIIVLGINGNVALWVIQLNANFYGKDCQFKSLIMFLTFIGLYWH